MLPNGLRAGDRSPVLSRSFGTAGLWRLHAVMGWFYFQSAHQKKTQLLTHLAFVK